MHLIRPAFENGEVASAHRGRHKLAVEVDLILDVVVGWAGELAVGHTAGAGLRA